MLDRTPHARPFDAFARLGRRTATSILQSLLPIAALAVTGCLPDDPHVSETSQAATVSNYVTGTCSTAVVLGLSKQIAAEVNCMNPTGLSRFQSSSRITFTSSAVIPYLGAKAKSALESAAAVRAIQINSAFRTVAQQYLLYRWYLSGRCGISAAAQPGRSNHQSGRALDLANSSTVRSTMQSKGWTWLGAGDPVHYDYYGSPDIRGQDVRAFQRLWNRNNPGDKIAEDGAYGPQTEARLKKSPATGFAVGASCASTAFEVSEVVQVDGPDRVQPLSQAHYRVTIQNNGDIDWPGTAELRLAGGAASQVHDDSWISTNVITTLGNAIPAGTMGQIDFDVTTPDVAEETPIFEELEISDGGARLGSVNLALTVVPGMEETTSAEGDDQFDQEVTGGCSTGGGPLGAGSLALLLSVVLCRRRRCTYTGS